MKLAGKNFEFWSIILLGASFLIFTIAIPITQESIDTTKTYYSKYIFNLQQFAQKHGRFIDTYDNAHFIDILLQEKVISNKNIKAALRIQDRLGMRCQHLLADAIMSASIDPSDDTDDTVSRHIKLRNTELDKLIKEFDKYTGPGPTAIGQKFTNALKKKNRWKNIFYCFGSLFFILGTFLQILTKKASSLELGG